MWTKVKEEEGNDNLTHMESPESYGNVNISLHASAQQSERDVFMNENQIVTTSTLFKPISTNCAAPEKHFRIVSSALSSTPPPFSQSSPLTLSEAASSPKPPSSSSSSSCETAVNVLIQPPKPVSSSCTNEFVNSNNTAITDPNLNSSFYSVGKFNRSAVRKNSSHSSTCSNTSLLENYDIEKPDVHVNTHYSCISHASDDQISLANEVEEFRSGSEADSEFDDEEEGTVGPYLISNTSSLRRCRHSSRSFSFLSPMRRLIESVQSSPTIDSYDCSLLTQTNIKPSLKTTKKRKWLCLTDKKNYYREGIHCKEDIHVQSKISTSSLKNSKSCDDILLFADRDVARRRSSLTSANDYKLVNQDSVACSINSHETHDFSKQNQFYEAADITVSTTANRILPSPIDINSQQQINTNLISNTFFDKKMELQNMLKEPLLFNDLSQYETSLYNKKPINDGNNDHPLLFKTVPSSWFSWLTLTTHQHNNEKLTSSPASSNKQSTTFLMTSSKAPDRPRFTRFRNVLITPAVHSILEAHNDQFNNLHRKNSRRRLRGMDLAHNMKSSSSTSTMQTTDDEKKSNHSDSYNVAHNPSVVRHSCDYTSLQALKDLHVASNDDQTFETSLRKLKTNGKSSTTFALPKELKDKKPSSRPENHILSCLYKSGKRQSLKSAILYETKNLRKRSAHFMVQPDKVTDSHVGHSTEDIKNRWNFVCSACEVKSYDLQLLKSAIDRLDVDSKYEDEGETIISFNPIELLKMNDRFKEQQSISGYNPPMIEQMELNNKSQHTDDVIKEEETTADFEQQPIRCFVFHNGVFVLWGIHKNDKLDKTGNSIYEEVSTILLQFSEGPLCARLKSYVEMNFCLIESLESDVLVPRSRVHHERFYLKTGETQELIAASLALAQSCRLAVYEEAVEQSIEKFDRLPIRLAANEFYRYVRYENSDFLSIRSWVAEVYALILDVNVVEDFLNIPKYFWDNDICQPFFTRTHRYFEIEQRVHVLNLRVRCLQDILKVISRERVDAQGVHLAWCIIILLAINIIQMIITEFLDKFRMQKT